MNPPDFVPLASRPTSFSAGENVSLKRKWQELSNSKSISGSSADSYDGPIVIVEDFRAGFDEPLPKLPLQMESVPGPDSNIPRYTECQRETSRIFEQADLDYDSISMSVVRGAKQTHPKTTIVIRVPEGTDKSLWRPTLITVGQMLHTKDSLDLQVTILEPKAEEHNEAFSISFGDPLIEIWPEDLKDPICEIIIDLDWLQLSICNWGVTKEDSKPTVLIVVEEKDDTLWKTVVPKIREVCDASRASSLQVLVEEGEFVGAYKDDLGGLQGHKAYQELIAMGHSIGVEVNGGGTMGGYLSLVDPKNSSKTPIFTTNWHVVRPQDPKFPVAFDKGPQSYGAWPQGISNVAQCPAQADMKSQIAHVQGTIQVHPTSPRLSYLRGRVNNGTANASDRETYQALVDASVQYQHELQYLKANNKKSSLNFGQCKMGSGYRTIKIKQGPEGGIHGNFALDWAIGEPVGRRIGGNILPTQEHLDSLAYAGTFSLRGKTHAESFSSKMFSGQDVFKVGRTTGLTVGVVEYTATETKIPRPANSAYTNPWPRRIVEHFAIKGTLGRQFSQGGDSGSWIFDDVGNLCGLLWGGVTAANVGYFTPIEFVIADIEKYTGKKVEIYKAQ